MAKQITTSIKVEEYEFLDIEGKHLFTIQLNAADLDIIKRYEEVVDFLDEIIKREMDTNEFFEMCEELKARLNKLFNSDISTPIFSVMNPFTPLTSGKLYIEEIIDKIGEIVEQELDTRVKKVQSRTNKYTAKYQK